MVAKRTYEPAVIQIPSFLSFSNSAIKDIYTRLNWREHKRLINPKALVDNPEAVSRNRHQDVLPWASNRIHLRGLPYSYINASPMSLGDGDHKERFIACQGPLESSHMWRMAWEQEVSVIVMLTLPIENGETKCLQYYPEDETDVIDEGGFKVTLLEKKAHNHNSDIRTLQISHGDEQRTLSHFLFKAWPDHGVPLGSDLAALFSVMEQSRAMNGDRDGAQRVVHCSAGVGRTGTFIALEHLMGEMDRGAFDADCDTDAVFETVDALREQRMRMVNEQQLKLIYQILRERWQERHAGRVVDCERPRKKMRKMPVNDAIRLRV